MIFENQLIPVTVNRKNIEWYLSKGYNANLSDRINVRPEDLTTGSSKRILVICDYCGEIISKKYAEYYQQNINGIIQKDCCYACRVHKQEESNLKTYGVTNTNKLESTREKSKKTTRRRYGHDFYFQTEEFKNQYIDIMNEKYGVDNAFQSEEVKEKIKQTNLERYDVEYVLQNQEIKERQEQTTLDRYGYDNAMKHPEILEKALRKSRVTMYKNQTCMVSTQQLFVHDIIGGELNYPVDKYSLDIAFPDDKFYVECDFSGHDLPILYGQKTKEEFDNDELKRYYYLKNRGWRMIRIISTADLLPSPNIIKQLLSDGVEYLKLNHSWIKFNIDERSVENSLGKVSYDYKELNKL